MRYCVFCGKKIPPEASFCQLCGKEQPVKETAPSSEVALEEMVSPIPFIPATFLENKLLMGSSLVVLFLLFILLVTFIMTQVL